MTFEDLDPPKCYFRLQCSLTTTYVSGCWVNQEINTFYIMKAIIINNWLMFDKRLIMLIQELLYRSALALDAAQVYRAASPVSSQCKATFTCGWLLLVHMHRTVLRGSCSEIFSSNSSLQLAMLCSQPVVHPALDGWVDGCFSSWLSC